MHDMLSNTGIINNANTFVLDDVIHNSCYCACIFQIYKQAEYYYVTCDTIVQANLSTMALKAMSINLPFINLIYNNL